jgi:hypothetical protein
MPWERAVIRLVASLVSVGFHILMVAVFAWPDDRTPQRPRDATAAAVQVFVVEPTGAAPGLKPFPPGHELFAFESVPGEATLPLPGFTFDFAKVGSHASLLFPFLTPGLSLDAFGRISDRSSDHRLFNPLTTPPASDIRPLAALSLTELRLQAIVDASWSRRDRWSVFGKVMALAEAHDPDTGALPELIQRYVQQNGLQPYTDTTIRDPRLWAQLGLAADHLSFIDFISGFARRHPSSKATTELLFLLDKLAQASLDVLATLLDSDPMADLQWTKGRSSDAYRLIEDLQRYYRRHLERAGIDSPEVLGIHYDRVRLSILTLVLHTTPHGYRSADARFLMGWIHWKNGEIEAAIDLWRSILPDPSDSYFAAYSGILAVLSSKASEIQGPLRREIERVLDGERGRWRDFSYTRLRKFGYRFDTY